MNPFTIAMFAGAGLNAIGKLMSGSSSAAIDRMQASVAATNADLLSKQADVAGLGVDFAGSKEKEALAQIATAGRSTLEAQRNYFAGGNLDPSFGSPLVTQAVTAGRIQTDVNLTGARFAIDKANALTTEANLRGQAASQFATSIGYSDKAGADMTAGMLGAGTALLSGAAGAFKGMSFGSDFGSGAPLSTMHVGNQYFPAYR